MAEPKIKVLEIDHINQLLGSTDESLEFYRRVYGVEIETIFRQGWGPYDNYVFKLGSMTLEVFTPADPAHSFGKQFARFGPNWQACLWRVPNLEEAIEVFRTRELPLVDVELDPDRRWAFTDPRSTKFSIQLEDRDEWDKTVTPNPLGVTGLAGFTVAVKDAEETATFYSDLVEGADVLYDESRPNLTGRAIGVKVDGYQVEFLSPTGDGEVSSFLEKNRERIRTGTWKVESFDQLEKHLAEHGITLHDGDRESTRLIAPEDNLGVRMQFTE